eukprot:6461976-Amphidinium_carterae.3
MAHLEHGPGSSSKAKLSKPPPPLKRNRSKKKKARGSSSGCPDQTSKQHQSTSTDRTVLGGRCFPRPPLREQQSEVRGLLVPPWREVEHTVPTPPPPVPAPVLKLVPAAKDNQPSLASSSQSGGVRGSPAPLVVPMPPPPVTRSTRHAPRLPLPPQAVPDPKGGFRRVPPAPPRAE